MKWSAGYARTQKKCNSKEDSVTAKTQPADLAYSTAFDSKDHVPRSGVAPAIAVLSGRSRGMGQLAAAGRLMSGSSLIAAMV
ncbi:hypothetical protein, partial [Ensifer sp. ENS05]|uniref:hypothetical protein n=1 Tax=Ensifer sp. ENS05 TaxID=2769277 RepID=UPI001AEE368C